MDARDVTPTKLSRGDVQNKAEIFREEHIHNENIPVDIEVVMQSTLGIQPIPIENLQLHCNMDGFISLDFKYIYIDKYHYSTNSYYKRVRFTLAHEIGHRELHRDIIENIKFESLDEWIKFRMNIQEESLGWFEWQASEFAGRLLVPINQLIIEYRTARSEVLRRNTGWNAPIIDDDELFSLTAPLIAPKFDVSTDVIEKRLAKENITKYFS
jgi:Zn-dependent peptidase ImmA (M78 family)